MDLLTAMGIGQCAVGEEKLAGDFPVQVSLIALEREDAVTAVVDDLADDVVREPAAPITALLHTKASISSSRG